MLKPVKRGGVGSALARRPAPQIKKRRECLRGASWSVTGPPYRAASPARVQQHFPAPDPYRAF